MTKRDSEVIARRYWREVWCEGNVDAVAALYDPAAHLNGTPLNIEEFQQSVSDWFSTFPDFTTTVDEVFAAGDRVVTRVTYRGTHQGPWAGLPSTGRHFEVSGIDIFRFKAGKIVEHWHEADHFEMARQLGARVVPGTAS